MGEFSQLFNDYYLYIFHSRKIWGLFYICKSSPSLIRRYNYWSKSMKFFNLNEQLSDREYWCCSLLIDNLYLLKHRSEKLVCNIQSQYISFISRNLDIVWEIYGKVKTNHLCEERDKCLAIYFKITTFQQKVIHLKMPMKGHCNCRSQLFSISLIFCYNFKGILWKCIISWIHCSISVQICLHGDCGISFKSNDGGTYIQKCSVQSPNRKTMES